MSPDGQAKPLPEEKLLKLIRGKKAQSSAGSADNTRASVPVEGFIESREFRALRWPAAVSMILGLVLLVEGGLLIMQVMRPIPYVSLPGVSAESSDQSLDWDASAMLAEVPSLAESASESMFASPSISSDASMQNQQPKKRESSAAAKELASRLNLMGIVAGEEPQAIIEDSQTRKTYFVISGQAVSEGAVVEKILENRVILSIDGETIELTL